MRSSTGAPHLRLQIPASLMRYPWELMHDRYGMIGDRFAFGRQVFMASEHARRRSSREPGAINVLVIGDPKIDDSFQANHGFAVAQLSGARFEAMQLSEAFQQLKQELAEMPKLIVTPLIGKRVTCFEMRQYLRDGCFDIIHFAGHGQFVQDDPEASAWVLSDGLLRARDIRNTLAWTESPPWLIFANACEASMEGESTAGKYQGDVYGLATACINQAVAAYIGPLWPVDDQIATQIAIEFYKSLLVSRLSLGESLLRAKTMVKQRQQQLASDSPDSAVVPRQALSWASFVLYGDPTRQLLESLWSPHAGAE